MSEYESQSALRRDCVSDDAMSDTGPLDARLDAGVGSWPAGREIAHGAP